MPLLFIISTGTLVTLPLLYGRIVGTVIVNYGSLIGIATELPAGTKQSISLAVSVMPFHNPQTGSGRLRDRAFLLVIILTTLPVLLCGNNVTAQSLAPVQAFSTGANKVATDGAYVMVGYTDIQVWNNNVNNGTKVRDIVTGYTVTEPIVALSALGGFVYAVTSNGPKSIRKWNYMTGGLAWRAPFIGYSDDYPLTDMIVSTSGVFTSYMDGTIKQWSLVNGTLISSTQSASSPGGFVVPVRKLFMDGITNRLYASLGRFEANEDLKVASVVPSGDFEGVSIAANFDVGNPINTIWKTAGGVYAYRNSDLATSGFYTLMLRTWNNTHIDFIRQFVSVIPGRMYQLRFRYSKGSTLPLPIHTTFEIYGKAIATDFNPVVPGSKWYTATSSEFLATGKACELKFTSTGCADAGGAYCQFYIDYIELVLVRRLNNTDDMEVIPVNDGGFENIVVTTTSVTYTGAFGNWTKIAGTGTVAIAKVGSNNFFNAPAASGDYALWMASVVGDDTAVSQIVTLVPGGTYMVRWHMAMRYVRYTSTENSVSSTLNVSLCGTMVAANFTAPSLLFEEASSALFTPIGITYMTCNLTLTIIRGPATLRSLLIDEVELVRVHNPHLGSSGSFEGLTTTMTSWAVYPGAMGGWTSSGHASGLAAIVRIPSSDCDNTRSIASPYVLWLQSSTTAPAVSISIAINTFVSGLFYRIRWSYARRKQGATVFTSPMLSVSVFGSIVSSGRAPATDVFATVESNTFIASGTTSTLTFAISQNATVNHMLIDDVEVILMKDAVIAGSNPLVKEYAVGTLSLTPLLDYIAPETWIATLPSFQLNALTVANGRLYVGISMTSIGSLCFVMEFSTIDGSLTSSYSTICNGGLARAIIVNRGQMLVGHIGGVAQISLSDGSLVRILEWTLGTTPMMDLAAGGWYLFASGNDSQALKWRLPEWVPTTTTTTTTRTSTTTTTTSLMVTTTLSDTVTPTTTGTATNAPLSPAAADEMTMMIKTIGGSAAVLLIALGIITGAVVRRRKYGPDPAYRRTYDQEMGLIYPRQAVQLTGPRRTMPPSGGPAYPPGFQRAVYAPGPYARY